MAFRANEGMDSLACVLSEQIGVQAKSPLILDFGTIGTDYSLQTNTFPVPIPNTDYLVCRSLLYGAAGAALTSVTGGEHEGHESGSGSHIHTIAIPENMRTFLPGDRVLVAWVQNDAVVIDIVKPANSI